ncbi:MAG: hypothetical protein ABWY56_01645 [Propionibacteriaceae bacterium]
MHRHRERAHGAGTRPGRLLVSAVAVLALGLTACGAPVRPELPTETPSPVQVRLPEGSVNLAEIGFENGPRDAFPLPRTVVISTRVDEPSGVTVVFSNPSAAALAAYLRENLPLTGFTVTDDDQQTASLTFSGYGWHGSFTGTGDSSAVILRP